MNDSFSTRDILEVNGTRYGIRSLAKLGSRFDLKRFHLLFIKQGSIPAGYFGQELLRQLEGK